MRTLSMGMMATTFLLGIGVVAVAFIMVQVILDARKRSQGVACVRSVQA